MESIHGMITECLKGFEQIIKCMGKEDSHGRMEDPTLDYMLWIKRKDEEYSNGLMAGNMLVIDLMASSME